MTTEQRLSYYAALAERHGALRVIRLLLAVIAELRAEADGK